VPGNQLGDALLTGDPKLAEINGELGKNVGVLCNVSADKPGLVANLSIRLLFGCRKRRRRKRENIPAFAKPLGILEIECRNIFGGKAQYACALANRRLGEPSAYSLSTLIRLDDDDDVADAVEKFRIAAFVEAATFRSMLMALRGRFAATSA
jgi:hypothetical protein